MTTPEPERRRRQAGVLLALVIAIVAALLVFVWLDGAEAAVSGGVWLALA